MYKLKTSMRNQFYFEREQLRGKISMIKKFLVVNNDFLLSSQQKYEKRLDICKNNYKLFLAEDDTLLDLTDYQQIFLNGCLMYLISQYEYFLKKIYKDVCHQTHNISEPIYHEIVNSCHVKITKSLNIKWHKCTLSTFDKINYIIEIRNKLVHVNGESYDYKEKTHKHIERHSDKIKCIKQSDNRTDISPMLIASATR